MTDMEAQVRDSLQRIAGEPRVQTMPPGTTRRIRRRQARVTTGIVALAVAALIAGAGLMQTLPHAAAPPGRPAEGRGLASDPLEAVPADWPQIRVADPSSAYVNRDDYRHVDGEKHVISSGTVSGSEFSFVGWTADGGPCGHGASLELAGPASPGERAATAVSTRGCQDDGDALVPDGADLELWGQGEGSLPELEASFGFVSQRVARLEVTLSDGYSVEIPIMEGLPGWNVSPFLVFPPQGVTEDLVAYDAQGRALARAPLCRNDGISNTCRNPVEQLIPPAAASTR